jgi:PKD repeat protein
LTRYALIIVFSFIVGITFGCNSTSIPIAPPGQDDNPNQNLPGPPVPDNPQPGDTEPLQVDVLKDKDSGKVPLKVTFTSVVTGGTEPYSYAWDFDSNGITDAIDPNPDALYASPGIYIATLTVEDDGGTISKDQVEIEACSPTPNAVADAIPMQGPAPLDVNFIAQNSTPQAGASIVEYRWDFDADGVWDYIDTATGNTAWTYDDPGNYYPVLRVKDNLGFWEETSLHIIVSF